VLEINVGVEEHLEILSRDPWHQGWLVKLEPRSRSLDAPELMDATAYEAFITASKH
jgi:glycine cleavage system H lipoate-binding protein